MALRHIERHRTARIGWLQSLRDQLSNERSTITQEMRRNMSLYDDKHWETFGSNRRAPWKMPGVVNYVAWIADTKSALMADNKPKAVYTTARREDACARFSATVEFSTKRRVLQ